VADAAKIYTAVEPPNFHFEVPDTLATANYHQVLEDSAVAQLKGWLGMTLQQPLNAQLESFTTTDVEGALQVGRLHPAACSDVWLSAAWCSNCCRTPPAGLLQASSTCVATYGAPASA
jgi:hypothetical protein